MRFPRLIWKGGSAAGFHRSGGFSYGIPEFRIGALALIATFGDPKLLHRVHRSDFSTFSNVIVVNQEDEEKTSLSPGWGFFREFAVFAKEARLVFFAFWVTCGKNPARRSATIGPVDLEMFISASTNRWNKS